MGAESEVFRWFRRSSASVAVTVSYKQSIVCFSRSHNDDTLNVMFSSVELRSYGIQQQPVHVPRDLFVINYHMHEVTATQ